MNCKFCNENNVRQSFAEVGAFFQVQATCPDCGSGWGETVTREQGLAMIAAKEEAEREAASKPKEEAKPKKKDK